MRAGGKTTGINTHTYIHTRYLDGNDVSLLLSDYVCVICGGGGGGGCGGDRWLIRQLEEYRFRPVMIGRECESGSENERVNLSR